MPSAWYTVAYSPSTSTSFSFTSVPSLLVEPYTMPPLTVPPPSTTDQRGHALVQLRQTGLQRPEDVLVHVPPAEADLDAGDPGLDQLAGQEAAAAEPGVAVLLPQRRRLVVQAEHFFAAGRHQGEGL